MFPVQFAHPADMAEHQKHGREDLTERKDKFYCLIFI